MRTFLPTPFLTQKEVQQILDTLAQGYPESQTRWRLKLSTLPLSEEEKDAVNEVFQFLLERLDRLLSDPAAGARQMRKLFLSRSDTLRPSHMVLIVSMLEEIAVELILQNSALDIHVGYRWIHSSLLNMAFSSFLGEAAFPRDRDDANGTDLSDSDAAFEEDQMELYEAILRYDEVLLTLNGLEDILSYSVREICRIAGFARAALFWYTPITRSLDGIYSHNIDLDAIRRIRELDYNIPGLKYVLREKKPIYLQDVKNYLPAHHIENFRVTSLVVAPLYGKDFQSYISSD